jgi:pimeloyl-ACP methyl ester carboxylesterase
VFKIILIIVVVIVLGYSLGGAIAFIRIALVRSKHSSPIMTAVGPRAPYAKKMQESADWFMNRNPQNVYITSYDGLKLHAYYLVADNAKGTVLLMHGYHSSGLRDFACIYEYFYNQGYTVLLPDQRAHGQSEGKFLTFGVRERFDCRDWINWLNNRPECTDIKSESKLLPIWIMGISMGSATVMYTAGFDLPKNVQGIIADCGYTRPLEMIKLSVFRDYHLITWTMLPVANILTKLFCGFGMREASTKKAFKTNQKPILFVHGSNDMYVPYKMSIQNYKLCTAPKDMLTTKATHALSFVTAPELYKKKLHEFMQKIGNSSLNQ